MQSPAPGRPGIYSYKYDHRTRRVERRELNGTVNGGKRVVSSFSGGTSVQERAVVEPEDMLANPDYDQYSNLLEYAFGTDPLSGANPLAAPVPTRPGRTSPSGRA